MGGAIATVREYRAPLRGALFLFALACAACVDHGVREPTVISGASEVEALAQRFIKDEWAKGIVIAVVRGDRIEIRGYGAAKTDGAAPDAHTLFEIGSVTKLFTALTLATMVADGAVAFEDPVAEYLPASARVPDYDGRIITLLTLATHTSGYPPLRNFNTEWDAEWLYSFLADYSLEREPGATYEYSNLGMGLLGHALSVHAGKPFADLVEERVLAPLGLSHTFVGASPPDLPLADGHDVELSPMQRFPAWGSGILAPAGAMRSDATDMAAFVRANLRPPPILREAILSTHAERVSLPDGKIGLGWHIGLEGAPNARLHNGQFGGHHAFVAFDVDEQVGVVVLANTASMAVDELGRALLQMLRGVPHALELPRLVKLSAEELDRCTGRYEIEPGFEFTITREGGTLFAEATDSPRYRIYPSSETTFHFRVDEARLEFEIDDRGRARRLVLHQDGEEMPGTRIE